MEQVEEKIQELEEGVDQKIKRGFNMRPLDPVPDVEWWDAFFLPKGVGQFPDRDIKEEDVYMDRITHYVQHPVPVKNEYVEGQNNIVVPLYLT